MRSLDLVLRLLCIAPLLMACQVNEPYPRSSETISEDKQVSESCAVLQSDKWHAWLDRYSNKESDQYEYRLNLVGEVILPNPGYSIDWSVGPMDRRAPPGIRINLLTTPSDNPTIQVLTPMKAEFTMDTPVKFFRSVSVYCGEGLLVEIPDVQLTD